MYSPTPSYVLLLAFHDPISGAGSAPALRDPLHTKSRQVLCSLRSHIPRSASLHLFLPYSHPFPSSFFLTSLTWIPNLDSIPLFPPQVSYHALPFPAFLLLKSGSSIHAFANAPVRSTMKNTSRVKCRGFACGGGKPGFRHLCPDCGKRFCPKCVRSSSRHACLPMVPADVTPSEESELLTNKTIGIARCEL